MNFLRVKDVITNRFDMLVSLGRHAVEMRRAMNRYRSTDVFFLGYPKTGNTWTRVLIGRYCQLLVGLDRLPLFDYYDRLGRCERVKGGPAMHFTHNPLEWTKQTSADLNFYNVVEPFYRKKVVLIARHPLDSLVSSWHQAIHRSMEYQGDLKSFIEHPVWGLEKFIRFYNLWAEQRVNVPEIALLRYEDLRRDAFGRLKAVIEFLGMEIEEELVCKAVEFSSFESMRKMEEKGVPLRYKSSGLDIFATGDKKNPNAFHVRKGDIGGYRKLLEPEAITKFEKQIIQELDGWYGYGHSA